MPEQNMNMPALSSMIGAISRGGENIGACCRPPTSFTGLRRAHERSRQRVRIIALRQATQMPANDEMARNDDAGGRFTRHDSYSLTTRCCSIAHIIWHIISHPDIRKHHISLVQFFIFLNKFRGESNIAFQNAAFHPIGRDDTHRRHFIYRGPHCRLLRCLVVITVTRYRPCRWPRTRAAAVPADLRTRR